MLYAGEMLDGGVCRYFREAVLPLDPVLEEILLTRRGPGRPSGPALYAAGLAADNRAGLLFPGLRKDSPPPPAAGTHETESGGEALTIRPPKPA